MGAGIEDMSGGWSGSWGRRGRGGWLSDWSWGSCGLDYGKTGIIRPQTSFCGFRLGFRFYEIGLVPIRRIVCILTGVPIANHKLAEECSIFKKSITE